MVAGQFTLGHLIVLFLLGIAILGCAELIMRARGR